MKTGRVRTKTPPPAEGEAPPPEPAAAPEAAEARRGPPGGIVLWIALALIALLACLAVLLLARGGGSPEQWVPVTRASGEWTAGVTVFGPQVTVEERWQSACPSAGNTLLQADTCIMKDTANYRDNPVDDYQEYAYNIYYEETWRQAYEAQGAEFVPTALGRDDRWEGRRHTVSVEELKVDTCTLTDYTVWVDDPTNTAQQIEIYLSDCEVWNHVTVTERVYEQAPWCQCQVTTVVALGQVSDQGAGLGVAWPQPSTPAGGYTQPSFSGRVTFVGGDYVMTVTTDDLEQYRDYLTGQYYIGVKNGKPVSITDQPPRQ